jgi:hypothetical protein
VQGRWLSPDPAGLAAANSSDPQRYAYVGNRPTNTTDSLGLFLDDPCDDLIGCGPPCDPFFGCGPCDPVFRCGCDPSDPSCVGPPGPIPRPPIGVPPAEPKRTGGVWPNNQTLGLPTVPNTSTFGLENLFSFLPGLNCGSSGYASVLTFTQPPAPTVSTGGPCAVTLATAVLVFAASSGNSSNTKNTDSTCSPITLPQRIPELVRRLRVDNSGGF